LWQVQSSGAELQTLNATVGNHVSRLALESLPTIARNTSTFLTLQSGISPDGSVAGTAVDQSSFQLANPVIVPKLMAFAATSRNQGVQQSSSQDEPSD
jgi:hypothetical protein